VRANTIHSLMRAGLIREQETEFTGPVKTMHLTEQGRAALTPR
jgi:DNA-binding PadR family transcriptional regulator